MLVESGRIPRDEEWRFAFVDVLLVFLDFHRDDGIILEIAL